MKLISRVRVRRHEIGDAREGVSRTETLAIFRLLGRSPERTLKILNAEIAREANQVVVLVMEDRPMSEAQKDTCESTVVQARQQSTSVVFCGGQRSDMLGALQANSSDASWFPTFQAFMSSRGGADRRRTPTRG
ncbi:MAG: hypothetical protein M0P63_11410 [Azoarcus sp.]|jgi:hypothetical protein|nr:hypothetical protein [Azoarcus sp.]